MKSEGLDIFFDPSRCLLSSVRVGETRIPTCFARGHRMAYIWGWLEAITASEIFWSSPTEFNQKWTDTEAASKLTKFRTWRLETKAQTLHRQSAIWTLISLYKRPSGCSHEKERKFAFKRPKVGEERTQETRNHMLSVWEENRGRRMEAITDYCANIWVKKRHKMER